MRACARCGYENPGPLAYCFRCGRRLGQAGPGPNVPALPAGPAGGFSPPPMADAGHTPGRTTEFAATVALPEVRAGGANTPVSATGGTATGSLRGGWQAVTYVFAYVRGRIHAEDRKRRVAGERRGAERLIEAALAELGAAAIAAPTRPAELGEAAAAVASARQRRESAVADLANAEKLQAAEDLRLGLDQAAAETEWKACTRGADELDRMLRELEDERRQLDPGDSRSPAAGDVAATPADSRARAQKLAALDEQFNTLRERAAALRASTTAARAKLDHATAARRTAASAMAAGLAAQTRARAEAERGVGDAIANAGRRALQLRLAIPDLVPRYARIDRLQQTITDNDRAVGNLDRHLGGYDDRKLVIGSILLVVALALVGALIWALAR